jgi:hypothetical protein
MTAITFKTTLFTIGDRTILLLPSEASQQLPSRNIAMVNGVINGYTFQTVLEPDGNFSHWLEVNDSLSKNAGIKAGDTVEVRLEPTKDWIQPNIPEDLKKALAKNSAANATWQKVTPMARWEWLRWIRATNNNDTRAKRIEVACSKLKSGMRRPCCFNTSACTVPEVSKSGVLLIPANIT